MRRPPGLLVKLACVFLVFMVTSTGYLLLTSQAQEQVAAKDLKEELPRIPAVPIDKVMSTFILQHGFHLELVANEPLVNDPVDACFDPDGRMYVAEMRDYPFSDEPRAQCPEGRGKKDAGTIRLLVDTDSDGKFDHSTVFLDKIEWPTSVACYKGGIFVTAAPNLYYAKDTNGDGVADIREVVYSGFSRSNVQGLVNNLKWGLDNHLYLAGGMNGGELKRREQLQTPLPAAQILRFDPVSEKMDLLSGGSQFGYSTDDWGHQFVSSNSNHIQQVVLPHRYLARNPYLPVPSVTRAIAVEGAAATVFRQSEPEPWRLVRTRRRAADPEMRKRLPESELVPTGFFTSATGVTIYRGSAYPKEYYGNAFIGDVGGNLVHRKVLEADGAAFKATRADAKAEFLTSSDNWFRPANFVNAPDGTLYILDVYRETIEHPASIPEDIKAHLDLESGDDRGRIYRLVSPDMKRITPPKLGQKTPAELVPELASPNSWNRETAQRLLWEAQDKSVVPALQELVKTSPSPLGKLHALYTLDGLQSLTEDILLTALKDESAGVREHAVRLSETLAQSSPKLVAQLTEMTSDPAFGVRWQLAFSLGELGDAGADGLSRLLGPDLQNSDFRTAWLSSTATTCAALFESLAGNADRRKQPGVAPLLDELAGIAGTHKEASYAVRVLAAITQPGLSLSEQQRWLSALGAGLARRGATISQLAAQPSTPETIPPALAKLWQTAGDNAANGDTPLDQRIAAVGLLAFAPSAEATPVLGGLLGPQTPPALQLATIKSLSQLGPDELPALLLAGWKSYSPTVRRAVTETLFMTAPRLQSLVAAVKEGVVKPGELDRDQKQLLLNHPQPAVRDAARAVLGSDVASNRKQVLADLQGVLELKGDVERGKAVFQKVCAACHQVGQIGKAVGPNLATVSNKSSADLLVAILDPNREALPAYNSYTLVTDQGIIVTGLIGAESATSITLKKADGAEETILRSNIDELVSNGVSLMPEGLEKDLQPQQIADVIEFVRSIPPEKK